MSEHTKTPWSSNESNGKWISQGDYSLTHSDEDTTSSAIIDRKGKVVCIVPEIHDGSFGEGERHANARHIVHCVNNYERLVEMLYEAEGHLRTLGYHYSNKVLDEKADKIESLLLELEAEKGG